MIIACAIIVSIFSWLFVEEIIQFRLNVGYFIFGWTTIADILLWFEITSCLRRFLLLLKQLIDAVVLLVIIISNIVVVTIILILLIADNLTAERW